MADETPLTITTSDRCPACSLEEIARREGELPAASVQVWSCLRCGLAFYRYLRTDDGDGAGGRRRRLPPIGGGAPVHPPWQERRPADYVDDLVCFGAEILREAQGTRERSRAMREERGARRRSARAPAA